MAQKQITEAGIHILAVVDERRARSGIYDIYQFRLRNLAGDILELSYKVSGGSKPARLVRDLQELKKRSLFFKAELRERDRMLRVVSIREPDMCQDELRSWMPESKLSILTR